MRITVQRGDYILVLRFDDFLHSKERNVDILLRMFFVVFIRTRRFGIWNVILSSGEEYPKT